jgi:hypothetical protein
MLWYKPAVVLPRLYTVAATAAPTPAAIIAYSIAVAPSSLPAARLLSIARRNRSENLRMGLAGLDFLDIVRSVLSLGRRHNSVVRCEIKGTSAGGIG